MKGWCQRVEYWKEELTKYEFEELEKKRPSQEGVVDKIRDGESLEIYE